MSGYTSGSAGVGQVGSSITNAKIVGPRVGALETLSTVLSALSELHSNITMFESRLDDQPSQPTTAQPEVRPHIGPLAGGLTQILDSIRSANTRVLELNNRF